VTSLFTAAELERDRAEAESRMLDTFAIKLSLGVNYNPATGNNEETFEDLFATNGRIKASSGLVARESEAGGRTVVTVTRELHIPIDSPAVPTGAVAICTAVHNTSDPTLLDARLRLAGPAPGSQTTARRLEVTEVLT
jgi:hypothetical protein